MKQQGFRAILDGRIRLDVHRYEEILEANGLADFNDSEVCDPAIWHIEGPIVYAGTRGHQRQYLNRETGTPAMASSAGL